MTTYNLWQIHKLLSDGFSKEELFNFCLYEPEFRAAYDEIEGHDPKSKVLRLIIDHALRRVLMDKVLAWAEQANPNQFAAHRPYILDRSRLEKAAPLPPSDSGDYYSCFIMYDPQDEYLAEQIYQALFTNAVKCWYAPEDARWGEHLWNAADIGILQHDKLLVILSEASLENNLIEGAVVSAIEAEKLRNEPILFPIRADDAVMKSQVGWAAYIRRTRFIGDFTVWQDKTLYERVFQRLLKNLARNVG